MAKYRKKPVVIEAIQFRYDNMGDVCKFLGLERTVMNGTKSTIVKIKEPGLHMIESPEGEMIVNIGDWIIRGDSYTHSPAYFEAVYEKVEDPPEVRCTRCKGCGQIANTDDGEPWSHWKDLPLESKTGVIHGIINPIPCPECGGKNDAD